MSIFDYLYRLFTPPPPPSPQPRRRARAFCESCGKEIAVIASNGRLWRHTCVTQPEVPDAVVDHRQ